MIFVIITALLYGFSLSLTIKSNRSLAKALNEYEREIGVDNLAKRGRFALFLGKVMMIFVAIMTVIMGWIFGLHEPINATAYVISFIVGFVIGYPSYSIAIRG